MKTHAFKNLSGDQFGPDLLPAGRKRIAARHIAISEAFYLHRSLFGDGRNTTRHLRQIRRGNAKVLRKLGGASALGGDVSFEIHAPSLVFTNSEVK